MWAVQGGLEAGARQAKVTTLVVSAPVRWVTAEVGASVAWVASIAWPSEARASPKAATVEAASVGLRGTGCKLGVRRSPEATPPASARLSTTARLGLGVRLLWGAGLPPRHIGRRTAIRHVALVARVG